MIIKEKPMAYLKIMVFNSITVGSLFIVNHSFISITEVKELIELIDLTIQFITTFIELRTTHINKFAL